MRTCIMGWGNDSAFCIAAAVTGEILEWKGHEATCPEFGDLMNKRAAEIGMTHTNLVVPSGRLGTSTAWDKWQLGLEAMKNPVFRSIAGDTSQPVHCLLLSSIPVAPVSV